MNCQRTKAFQNFLISSNTMNRMNRPRSQIKSLKNLRLSNEIKKIKQINIPENKPVQNINDYFSNIRSIYNIYNIDAQKSIIDGVMYISEDFQSSDIAFQIEEAGFFF